jgi:hypothetical protein
VNSKHRRKPDVIAIFDHLMILSLRTTCKKVHDSSGLKDSVEQIEEMYLHPSCGSIFNDDEDSMLKIATIQFSECI